MIPFAFLPVVTENWLILSSHFVTGLKVVLNPGLFEKGSSDLATWSSLPQMGISSNTQAGTNQIRCIIPLLCEIRPTIGEEDKIMKTVNKLSSKKETKCKKTAVLTMKDLSGQFLIVTFDIYASNYIDL